jgi:hypothetical protein
MSDDDTTIDEVWTVERHLEGKPAESVAMFHRFVELVGACGPYEPSPSKSSVTFNGTRRGFAGARPTASGLAVYLDLQRALESPRVRKGLFPVEGVGRPGASVRR